MQPVAIGRPIHGPRPTVVLAAIVSAALLYLAVSVSAPANALAATTMVTACDGVNLRTGAGVTGTLKTTLKSGTRVSVAATVSGGAWRAECAGKIVSGSKWYRISAINGKTVASLYRVTYVYAATGLLKSPATATLAASTSSTLVTACGVNLRYSPTMRAAVRRTIRGATRVTVTATVTGSRWRTSCAGKVASGSKWYRISAINGRSVASLYRVKYVYAATSLFKRIAVPVTPPAPTPPPATTLYAACNDVNVRTSASTSGTLKTTIAAGTPVSVIETVAGGSWSTSCAGQAVSGSQWYRITSINGQGTGELAAVTYLYAATGLFSPDPPAPAPLPEPPPGIPVTEGIDVSHWQGPIDWAQVAAAGKRFAFMKASEDIDFVDWTFLTNKAGATAAGLRVGAYHFAQPDPSPNDGILEADHFMNNAALASGDLLPVLDLERTGGLTPPQLQQWTAAFLNRVYERSGLRGLIYVSPSFWSNNMLDTDWFAANGYPVIWIAHWTTAGGPTVPAADWGGRGWTFWQYTSSGSVPGIAGRVDLNRYKGTDLSGVLIP